MNQTHAQQTLPAATLASIAAITLVDRSGVTYRVHPWSVSGTTITCRLRAECATTASNAILLDSDVSTGHGRPIIIETSPRPRARAERATIWCAQSGETLTPTRLDLGRNKATCLDLTLA